MRIIFFCVFVISAGAISAETELDHNNQESNLSPAQSDQDINSEKVIDITASNDPSEIYNPGGIELYEKSENIKTDNENRNLEADTSGTSISGGTPGGGIPDYAAVGDPLISGASQGPLSTGIGSGNTGRPGSGNTAAFGYSPGGPTGYNPGGPTGNPGGSPTGNPGLFRGMNPGGLPLGLPIDNQTNLGYVLDARLSAAITWVVLLLPMLPIVIGIFSLIRMFFSLGDPHQGLGVSRKTLKDHLGINVDKPTFLSQTDFAVGELVWFDSAVAQFERISTEAKQINIRSSIYFIMGMIFIGLSMWVVFAILIRAFTAVTFNISLSIALVAPLIAFVALAAQLFKYYMQMQEQAVSVRKEINEIQSFVTRATALLSNKEDFLTFIQNNHKSSETAGENDDSKTTDIDSRLVSAVVAGTLQSAMHYKLQGLS